MKLVELRTQEKKTSCSILLTLEIVSKGRTGHRAGRGGFGGFLAILFLRTLAIDPRSPPIVLRLGHTYSGVYWSLFPPSTVLSFLGLLHSPVLFIVCQPAMKLERYLALRGLSASQRAVQYSCILWTVYC